VVLKRFLSIVAIALAVLLSLVAPTVPAGAAAAVGPPTITGLSSHSAAYWGGETVTITGTNLVSLIGVWFGAVPAVIQRVVSATEVQVEDPGGSISTVDVRVRTATGTSPATTADRFTWRAPVMSDPINGGWTAYQEEAVASQFMSRAATIEHSVPTAPRSSTWTLAMGLTAARRATSWAGLPYSWSGGSIYGPTYGACYSGDGGGGEFDCHIWGFDCSGLAMYGWGPYISLPHYAASQQVVAGSFHPSLNELMPGDLLFYAGGQSSGIGHVVIYIGGGRVVQAEESGYPVLLSTVPQMPYIAGHYFGATRPLSPGVQGGVPTVTGVSVTSGPTAGGGMIHVYGRGFTNAASVMVGGDILYSPTVLSDGDLEVRMPVHAPATVDVRVSSAWGASAVTGNDRYTYVGLPGVTGVSRTAAALAGGPQMAITGVNFIHVTGVYFGSTPARVTTVTPTRLTAVVPPHAAGLVIITVRTMYGTGHPSALGRFYYIAPPQVSALSPASGPTSGGTPVTLTGANFVAVTSVTVGGHPATGLSVASPSQLTFTVPAGTAGTAPVVVTGAYGSSAPVNYAYIPAAPARTPPPVTATPSPSPSPSPTPSPSPSPTDSPSATPTPSVPVSPSPTGTLSTR
jgi:cell wall-associated NlpC family hydrolase